MLIILQISCLQNTKAIFSKQIDALYFESEINTKLQKSQQDFCQIFDSQKISIEVVIGNFTFKKEDIFYQDLGQVKMFTDRSCEDFNIGSSTIATFYIIINSELLDQSGQIDKLVVRHYNRLTCFEKGIIQYDKDLINFKLGRQRCIFDPGNTSFTAQIYINQQYYQIKEQQLGVVSFNEMQHANLGVQCKAQPCYEIIQFLNNQEAIFGYYEFTTQYKISKNYSYFDNTGVTQQKTNVMQFKMFNQVEIKYTQSAIELLSDTKVIVLKNYLILENFPLIDEPVDNITVVFADQKEFQVFRSNYYKKPDQYLNCSNEGCLQQLNTILNNYDISDVYSYIKYPDGQKAMVPLQAEFPCFTAAQVYLYDQDICVQFDKIEQKCQFSFGIQIIQFTVTFMPNMTLQAKFDVNSNNLTYCLKGTQEVRNFLLADKNVHGVVYIDYRLYPYAGFQNMTKKQHLYLGWIVVIISSAIMTIFTLILLRKDRKQRQAILASLIQDLET